MTTTTINPASVTLRHDVSDDRLAEVTASIDAEGWTGRPVVVYEWEGRLRNITGCHRIGAAADLGLERIPAVVIRPADEDELDRLDYAAANDDDEAAYVIGRFFGTEIGALVEQG